MSFSSLIIDITQFRIIEIEKEEEEKKGENRKKSQTASFLFFASISITKSFPNDRIKRRRIITRIYIGRRCFFLCVVCSPSTRFFLFFLFTSIKRKIIRRCILAFIEIKK